MKPLTVVLPYGPSPDWERMFHSLTRVDLVKEVIVLSDERIPMKVPERSVLSGHSLCEGPTLHRILSLTSTEYLLIVLEPTLMPIEPEALKKLLTAAESNQAGIVYSDFYDQVGHQKTLHPVNEYQLGSVRNEFDFGALMLLSVPALQEALKRYGPIPEVKFAGLYDLRLKVSIDHSVLHLPEPLYSVIKMKEASSDEKLFAYLNPTHRTLQREMEMVFTDHLKRVGAYLPPPLKEFKPNKESFPVEASVIIPVRNREKTIEEAVKSALSQVADFPFNILVVDNYSTDGTTAILSHLARRHPQLIPIVPRRTDLRIGGCWNEAIHHPACGRYAIQLDSDDLYRTPHALQKMVEKLRQGNYAMVIGSYTLVDAQFNEIPPGLVDHREWTDENGHNNALRINGLGAPRGFHTSLLRKIGFPNVSYGEDYAVALRVCREYRIGRIYESLYLCRRWSGNTDANLTIEEENRKNAFKDLIRSAEILARQKIVCEDRGH